MSVFLSFSPALQSYWATHQRLHFTAAAQTLLLLNAKSCSILLEIRRKASKVAKVDIFDMIMLKLLFLKDTKLVVAYFFRETVEVTDFLKTINIRKNR